MRDYTFKDVVYYFGLFIGAGVTYMALERVGVQEKMFRLIPALIVGVGLGWLAERVYLERNKK